MELILQEERCLLHPFIFSNKSRLPTLTDVYFLEDNFIVLAHRSAGKFYLLSFNFTEGQASILDTVEVEQTPDLFTVHKNIIYSANFTNKYTKIPIQDNKFGKVEYIPIHERNIYHGATTYKDTVYFTQALEQYYSADNAFCISVLDTKTDHIEHRFPQHKWDRIKKVEFLGDSYMLMIATKNYYPYADSSTSNPILTTHSQVLLLDAVTWKTVDSLDLPHCHADSMAIQDNCVYITAHSALHGGLIVRSQIAGGAFQPAQKMSCIAFPHGIAVHEHTLAYTAYETSGLYIHPLADIIWSGLSFKKWSLPFYATPKMQDMAVLIPYFNPTKSIRLLQNLQTIRTILERAAIPHFVGEMAFGKEPFELPNSNNIFQFRSKSYGFYKELIANRIIESLPDTFTKFTLMDSDVVFERTDWYDAISEALQTYEILQPFETVAFLNFDYIPQTSLVSLSAKPDTEHSASGFVWSFQRFWWQKQGGLYELGLIGGGDVWMCRRVGLPTHRFSSKLFEITNIIVSDTPSSFLEGTIYHLPHGKQTNRQYHSRVLRVTEFLQERGLKTITDCIVKNEKGILECRDEFLEDWNYFVLDYFRGRKDDYL